MQSYQHEYVRLADVCQANGLDYDDVMTRVSDSNDCVFGVNADTLIHGYVLESILHADLDFGDFDNNILVSLGS